MKKLLYLITLFICNLTLAQTSITLEHSYVLGISGNQGYGVAYAFNVQQGLFYYTKHYESPSTIVITIYDDNHNFYKTFDMVGGGDIHFITDKLFNNDDLIEFLYVKDINTYLINEDGVILYTWSDRWDPKLYKDNDNNYKLVVYNNYYTNSDSTSDVYALGGTLSLDQQELYLKKSFIGFPNPATNTITISNGRFLAEEVKLEVFNMNGRKILEKTIMSGEKEIIFDISSYSSGTYIYKINGEAHKFIKQ